MLDVAFCAIPTVFMSAAISIASMVFGWRAVLVIFAMCLTSLALGRAVLTIPLPSFRAAGELLVGTLLSSLIIFAICDVFVVSAGTAALLTGLIAMAAVIPRYRHAKSHTAWTDLVLMLLICLAGFIWSWRAIHAVPRLFATDHFDAWTDYFIHASEISQFADFGALRGTTIFASGAPLPLYHYGSYMFSAALAALSGTLSLAAATAFWTPFGYILLGLGAAVLGGVLAQETGGFLAVSALLLIPSASHYGLANPFFDFHWLLQISSSGSYAIACASLSLCAITIWLRTRHPSALAWAVFFTLATFEFRVQVFAPLVLTNAFVWLVAWRPARRWQRPALVVSGLLIVFAVMLILQNIQRAPHFFTGAHHPIRLLLAMHGMEPSNYGTFYARLVAEITSGAGPIYFLQRCAILAIGIVLLIAAAFGALFPAYLAALLWRLRTGRRRAEDLIPLFTLIAYLTILVFFPSNPLEKLEFAHRPYVLVYAVLAIWCASFVADFLRPAAWHPPAAAALGFALLMTPLSLESKAQISALAWGFHNCDVPVPSGLIAAANYVRTHAANTAIIGIPPSSQDDAFLALSQRPEFFPGDEFLAIQSGLPAAALAARQAALLKMLAHPTAAAQGTSWIVTFPTTDPTPPAVFASSGFSVFHVTSTR